MRYRASRRTRPLLLAAPRGNGSRDKLVRDRETGGVVDFLRDDLGTEAAVMRLVRARGCRQPHGESNRADRGQAPQSSTDTIAARTRLSPCVHDTLPFLFPTATW